jgi:Domain of unknown function (DUF4145)
MKGYIAPRVNEEDFTCPTCSVRSYQRWSALFIQMNGVNGNQVHPYSGHRIGRCDACKALTIWHNEKLAYPQVNGVVEPNPDMPKVVMEDFLEAVRIFNGSARASCALLRLAVQRLCIELGLPGKNLNEDIGTLVTRGLPEQIRQSLDIVRVIGNEQVHPGVIDVRDDPSMALPLFTLVNLITEYTISNPRRIQELHDRLPAGAKAQIEKRDSLVKS